MLLVCTTHAALLTTPFVSLLPTDLCGFDDFFLANKAPSSAGTSRFRRRKGIVSESDLFRMVGSSNADQAPTYVVSYVEQHAQEHSVLLTFAKVSGRQCVYSWHIVCMCV